VGAFGASGTGIAIDSCEPDLDYRVLVAILTGHPQDTGSTLRAGRRLLVPVNRECRDVKALLRFGLLARVSIHRPDQRHVMLCLAGHQVVSGNIASVDNLLAG
jgi:hypothetical protein